MTDQNFQRLDVISPLTPADAAAVRPTVLDWTARAAALSDFVNTHIGPDIVPITVFISSEVKTS